MFRFLALLIVLVPIFFAMFGIKLMRDTLFGISSLPIPSLSIQFLIGFLSFSIGLYLIGSFILHRDRKQNKVQQRFKR
jgi:TRAP-type C4-dicarboxylate transport system permease small subunit